MQETLAQALCLSDPLEEKMATYSSILTWEMPWAEETGRLQSQRFGHNLATTQPQAHRTPLFTFILFFTGDTVKHMSLTNTVATMCLQAFFGIHNYLFFGGARLLLLSGIFCSCGEEGLLLFVVHGLLFAGASLIAEHGLSGVRTSIAVVPWLESRGSAVVLRIYIILSRGSEYILFIYNTGLAAPRQVGSSRPGIKPVSPALEGRFFTTELPGKPCMYVFNQYEIWSNMLHQKS